MLILQAMSAVSLYELNEFIRRIMALNFPEAIWVKSELAQLGVSRGHYYLDLVEKEESGDDIIAKANAVIWERTYNRLRRKIGKNLEDILQEGMEILVQVKVDFHEQYGLKLIIEDIDPAFTLGKLEIQRRATIDQLKALQLLGRNKTTELPAVVQRIAVISSVKAAGFKDYLDQLSNNAYGYTFKNTLLHAAMQGKFASKEIKSRLEQVALRQDEFDCVVIIRGGGAKLDLLAYDDFELSKTAATIPIPILTGIGHEIDETVLDLMVYQTLKTPTAVADFLIEHNMRFESELEEIKIFLQQITGIHIMQADRKLDEFQQRIQFGAERILDKKNFNLNQVGQHLGLLKNQQLEKIKIQLSQLEEKLAILDPEHTLRRGFTLTTLNNKIIKSPDEAKEGDLIESRFFKGTLTSKVLKNEQ